MKLFSVNKNIEKFWVTKANYEEYGKSYWIDNCFSNNKI